MAMISSALLDSTPHLILHNPKDIVASLHYFKQFDFIFKLTFIAVARSEPRHLLCAAHSRTSLKMLATFTEINTQVES
jgi:hypothetical protein